MNNNSITGTIKGGSVSGTVTARGVVSGNASPASEMSGDIMHTVLKGLSAYEIAVEQGYKGTEEEWLNSLGATVDVGTVTYGDEVTIVNSGTKRDAIFDFTLPNPASINSLTQDDIVIFNCGSATEVI